MNVILTGFMGTGKTIVGKKLAKRLGWKFFDVDQLIEERAKMPIAKIFTEHGEAVFRRMERRWLHQLRRSTHQVIATGGGAFVDPINRRWLRASGPVICLTARPRVILQRMGRHLNTRPLLAGKVDPLTRIRQLLTQRASAYAQADLTLDTSDLSIDQVVEYLWRQLSPMLCRSWQYLIEHAQELGRRYGGRYVVVVNDRIVASGESQLEAYRNASSELATSCETGIYYIPLREDSLTALTTKA